MTPKEKAVELYENFYYAIHLDGSQDYCDSADKSALIAIDEIINLMANTFNWSQEYNGNIHYWQEVKQELENL